jgi:hypothetical protein
LRTFARVLAFVRERSECYILQSLFIALTGAGGGQNDMRKLRLHVTELAGKDSRDRHQLGPCVVVCRRHSIQFVGTKEWCEVLKGDFDDTIHVSKFVDALAEHPREMT